MRSKQIEAVASTVLLVGTLSLLFAVTVYFKNNKASNFLKTGLSERDFAINSVKDKASGSYSFSTGFTPGLGYVNADDAQKKAEAQAQEKLTTP